MTNYQSYPPNQPGGGQPPPPNAQPEQARYDLAGNPLPPSNRAIEAPLTQTDASNPALYPPVLNGYPPLAQPGRQPTGTYPGYGAQLPDAAANQPYGAPPAGYTGQFGDDPYAVRKKQTALMVGLGVAIVALLIVIGVMKASKPAIVAPPASYTLYVSPDKTFTCQGPKNWSYRDFGVEGRGIGGMIFDKGDAKLQINSSLLGSLMGDILKPPPVPDDSGLPSPPPAIENLHAFYAPNVKKNYKEYREGSMAAFTQPAYGDARYSEFTARRSSYGPQLKGIRVTMLGTERGIEIVGECPEASWSKLRESYWQVMMSVTQGVPPTDTQGTPQGAPATDTQGTPQGAPANGAQDIPQGAPATGATPAADTPASPQPS
jgi:hypothetical protein